MTHFYSNNKNMNIKSACLSVLILFLFVSCNNTTDRKITEKKWIGRTIIFPENLSPYSLKGDSVCLNATAPYKILLFTDSAGCTGCKLNLEVWKKYMAESELLFKGKLDFIFYFQPQDEEELYYLLRAEEFYQTVFIDKSLEFYRINTLPDDPEFRCFLLNAENKILAIGSPVADTLRWTAYKEIIKNGKQ